MTTIKLRRGTAAEWTSSNPVLNDGEVGFERDTNKHKIGDGVTAWNALAYFVNETEVNKLVSTEASSRWRSVNLMPRSDAFFVSGAGDQAADLNAFFADTNLAGKRRIIGSGQIASTVVIPADMYVDKKQAVLTVTSDSTRAFQVGARTVIEAGTVVGRISDYVPSRGSSSQVKTGYYFPSGSDDVQLLGVNLIGFGESGVYGVNAKRARVHGLRFDGVHGKPGNPANSWVSGGVVVIPAIDARSRAITATGGCVDWDVDDVGIENASLGIVTGGSESGWRMNGIRGTDIMGQHLIYHQGPDGSRITDVQGRRINLNVVKVQLTNTSTDHAYGLVIADIVALSADSALFMTNVAVGDDTPPAAWAASTTYGYADSGYPYQVTNDGGKFYEVVGDVVGISASSGGPTGTGSSITDGTVTWRYIGASPKEYRSATVSNVSAYDCNRLAYLDSGVALTASNLSGYGIKKEGVTLKRLRGAVISGTVLEGTGWTGLYFRGISAGGSERVTVSDFRIRNPNPNGYNPTSGGSIVSGIYYSDALATSVTLQDFNISADNGLLTHGFYSTVSDAAAFNTTRFRRGSISGYSVAPMRFATKPAGFREFSEIEMGDTAPINFPDSRPTSSIGFARQGFVAAPYDPAIATANVTASMVAGVLTVVRMTIDDYRALRDLRYTVGTAGSGLTVGQCFMGVYEGVSGGALLGQTADLSTDWASSGDKSPTLVVPVGARSVGSWVHVAMLGNGTTMPLLRGNISTTGKGNLGGSRFLTGGSGLIALPATLPTLTASSSPVQPFVGIRP